MSQSIWPYDTFLEPKPPTDNNSIGTVTCFVVSPFKPKERWDEIFKLIQDVCGNIGKSLGVNIQSYRADHIVSSGIIHPEIWKALRTADFIICDVTGHNGNVMLELGVAAAWRKKEHIVIIRDNSDEKSFLFDINPARHLIYEITYSGIKKFMQNLSRVISDVLSTFPAEEIELPTITLPFYASLTDQKDVKQLYTESITHRRILADCLEFGAPLMYRYSWMSLGNLMMTHANIKAKLRMTYSIPEGNHTPFMGVMVRGQNFYANMGHLIFVRRDGVFLTMRENDVGDYHDEPIGNIPSFKMEDFTSFDITIDETVIDIKVNDLHVVKKLEELPYVFSKGGIFFIVGYCRVGIKDVEVTEI